MDNALIDNSENSKLVSYIKELITNPKCDHIMIASGYWDLPGTALILEELQDFFRKGGKLDLLIGQEPILQYYQVKKEEYNKFPDFYIQKDVNKLTEDFLPVGKLILENGKTEDNPEGKFEIRVYGQNTPQPQFLHAKCYIFLGDQLGTGIIGSSNFTRNGLQNNDELNYLEGNGTFVAAPMTVHSTTKSHKVWFEEHWEKSVPWTGKFIKEILKPSPIGKIIEKERQTLSPYEVYIKYLQLQFGDMIDSKVKEVIETYLPSKYNALEYQLDAVKQCFSVMKRYGGFLLGDVVGLGKTIVGVLLIRHFIENASKLGRLPNVLIVTPPAIKKNWIKTINEFDEDSTTKIQDYVSFVTTGSIGKIFSEVEEEVEDDELGKIDSNDYGLILIDESHNFRNSNTNKYNTLDRLIGNISPTPYVGLLSATPQNNSPKDIFNQIQLFQRTPKHSNLPGVEGGKLDSFFNAMEEKFMEARNLPQDTPEQREIARKIIKEVSEQIRKSVLNDILVRRTRSDIKNLYGGDAELLKFPTVKGPHNLHYKLNPELKKLFDDTIEAIVDKKEEGDETDNALGFYRYAAITRFVKDDNKKLFEKRNLNVNQITKRLKFIMQILLVKRLESSITAFKKSLKNLDRYNDVMIDMLNHDCVYICQDIDVNKVHAESKDDFSKFSETLEKKIDAKVKAGKINNRKFRANDFLPTYLNDLLQDKKIISDLLKRWNAIETDPKFERFIEAVKNELFAENTNNPSGQESKKLVIFTEAVDTIETIETILKDLGFRVLTVKSEDREKKQEDISRNFDANFPKEQQRNDYDVIITTEVLAEGVNLHRANVILNYDTPWNATRLMQRIGRVNRIGSKEEFVHVFNFFPSEDGNKRIRLVEKAYAKLQSFHEMFGEDNKVYSDAEELTELDLKNLTEGEESLYNPFIRELKDYKREKPLRYEEIMNINSDHLGGVVENSSREKSLYVFTDATGGYISVELDLKNKDTQTNIISPLSTMEFLKCDRDTIFDSIVSAGSKQKEEAEKAYQQFVVNYQARSDIKKNQTEALKILTEIRNRYVSVLSQENKRTLIEIRKLINAGETYVINLMLKYNLDQQSLFGVESDINAILESAFSNISNRALRKRGESRMIISETK